MAVAEQAVIQVRIVDADPAVPGSGTPFNAASVMPNLDEIFNKFNGHTHTEYAVRGQIVPGDFNFDVATQAELDAETTARTDADATLQVSLDDELVARENADTTLQTNIDAETTARETAITNLSDYIDAQVAAEATARGNADAAETLARQNADTAETNARVAADALLVPSDGSYASTATPVLKARVVGDANARFQVLTSGFLSFGPGNAAADVNLFRASATGLRTNVAMWADMGFSITGNATGLFTNSFTSVTTKLISSQLITDTAARYIVGGDGKTSWGPGNAVVDTTLYRDAANVLRTDGEFRIGGVTRAMATSTAFLANSSPLIAYSAYIPTGNTLIRALTLSTDAQSTFSISGGGLMQWGVGGTTVPDLNLYRASAGVLKTDYEFDGLFFRSNQTAVTNNAFTSQVIGDAVIRYVMTADGKMAWGDGTNSRDTFLYRSGSGILKTDGQLSVQGQAAFQRPSTGNNAVYLSSTTDVNPRLVITAGGVMQWGDGTNPVDTNFYRGAAGVLETTGMIRPKLSVASSTAFSSWVTGDTQPRFLSTAAGGMAWGSGTSSTDTNLYRGAANQLQTDGFFNFTYSGATTVLLFNQSAGNGILRNRLLAADAQNAFTIYGDGHMAWGAGGASAPDVILARGGGNTLQLGTSSIPGRLNIIQGTAGSVVLGAEIVGDTNMRFLLNAAGSMFWGDGTNATDTTLQRASAGVLSTNGAFLANLNGTFKNTVRGQIAIGGDSNGSIELGLPADTLGQTPYLDFHFTSATVNSQDYNVRLVNDGDRQFTINVVTDGVVARIKSGGIFDFTKAIAAASAATFGGDSVSNLYRPSAGALKTDGQLVIGSHVSTNDGQFTSTRSAIGLGQFAAYVTGDANPRFKVSSISSGGKLEWSDGTNIIDTNLYRFSAGVLKTDNALNVGGVFTQNSGATTGTFTTLSGVLVDTATGASLGVNATATINPAADSNADFRSLSMSATISAGFSHTLTSEAKGAYVETRWQASGSVTGALVGVHGTIVVPTAAVSFGTIAKTIGVRGVGLTEFASGAITGTITTAVSLYASSSGSSKISVGTAVGVEVEGNTLAATNIGVRIAKSNTYSLQLSDTGGTAAGGITFGTDTNLYRSAANTLKTDDSLAVSGVLSALGAASFQSWTTYSAIADPGVAGVGQGRLYLRSNAGKMQLVIQMPTGAPIVLATEA